MKLYDVAVSPNAKKVRVCAAELGISLETVPLDPAKLRDPAYLEKNPMGKVPTLEDDGFVLFESAAIMSYLASKNPDAELVPREPCAQADMWRWILWYTSHMQPWMSTLTAERLIKPSRGMSTDEAAVAYAQGELTRFVPVLDQHLAGREFVLARFTIADIAIGMSLEVASIAGLSLEPYPNVVAWLARLQRRATWKR
jgi:glutathione S-transferase